jgi:hypothetical protein
MNTLGTLSPWMMPRRLRLNTSAAVIVVQPATNGRHGGSEFRTPHSQAHRHDASPNRYLR